MTTHPSAFTATGFSGTSGTSGVSGGGTVDTSSFIQASQTSSMSVLSSSYAFTAASSSYATTASYAMNGGSGGIGTDIKTLELVWMGF